MKICMPLFLFVLQFFSHAQEGNFKWQNPLPQGNDLNGCCCASDRYAWAVGYAGTIIKSEDKGETWTIQNSGVSKQLNGVSFLDSLNGWACGNTTILHTSDGGETWEQQIVPVVPGINDIQFINLNLGWAVCEQAHILKTTDGGSNWSITNINLQSSFWSVHFTDSLSGFVSGSKGAFFITSDGGETWQQSAYFSEDYWLRSVFFTSPDTGYVSGLLYDWIFSDPIVCKTTDGGTTWALTYIGNPNAHNTPFDMYFTDPLHGYLAGSNSAIYQTSDAGESWTIKLWGEYHHLSSLAFFDQDYGISVGREGQVLRKLGGPFFIWKYIETGPTVFLNDIVFTDELNGWAVGGDNTILHTTDGGESWEYSDAGFPYYYSWFSVTFTDSQHGWIAGYSGKIIHTNDGGMTWHAQNTNTGNTLYSVFFIDENYGWAVGEDDIRLRTTNGGQTWFGAPSTMWEYTNDVFFIDHMTGWVCGGYDGFINKTTNGGANWVMQYQNTDAELYSIIFTDQHNGWAVGENSTLLHTLDGGSNWIAVENDANTSLEDVFFLNSLEGYITGNNGVIMHTTDGGANWTYEMQITDNYLEAAYFTDQNSGWICGENGTILAFKPGNPVELEEPGAYFPTAGMNIFPNPCQSVATVRFDQAGLQEISVYDLSGKLIKKVKAESASSQEIMLNFRDYNPGVYLIKAVNGDISNNGKIILY